MSRGETLYKKVGRKYEQLHVFHSEPAPGVWIVEHGENYTSKRLISRVGDLPNFVPLINLETRREAVQDAVAEVMAPRVGYSIVDIVDAVFRALAEDKQ